jgi:hypothetical protein
VGHAIFPLPKISLLGLRQAASCRHSAKLSSSFRAVRPEIITANIDQKLFQSAIRLLRVSLEVGDFHVLLYG